MNQCKYLHNIINVYVSDCYVKDYPQFLYNLKEELVCKYSLYYGGLQLYQKDQNHYIVIAVYFDVCGLNEMISRIENFIERQYEETFGGFVKRTSILEFSMAKRVIG